ncbi:P-loop containing nucleoside triphosphate hydrolase protein [Favolaschia claudopus]|uniref:Vesicular-fusion protein SEC18 n=1 Tax=Favolaschia claudopus TaxID=2862362 RepID=A0AAW0ED86_9AGAR
MSRNYSSLPSGPRAGGRPPPPQSMQYNQPPNGYNDPPSGTFERRGYEQRSYDRKPPPPVSSAQGGRALLPTLWLSRIVLVVHPSDFQQGQHVLCKGEFPMTVIHDNTGKLRPGCIGASALQRQWIGLAVAGDSIPVDPLPSPPNYLQSLDLDVGFLRKQETKDAYSADELARNFIKAFNGLVITVGELMIFDYHGQNLKVTVRGLSVLELADEQRGGGGRGHSGYGPNPRDYGIIMEKTDITMMKSAEANGINIKSSAKKAPPNAILAPNFKFADMGIGGLDAEFSDIFRRAFASRVFPPGLVDKLGIEHVKGLLLHGPPGTGKTLIARQIGKMLKAREPKIVNGPEILSKFVGASEENIRKLFEDAEKEYKEKGDESELHIIIFDELDAIFKQRGSTNSGTGVGDSVVNQLLSKMDGVDSLNNILIIGMTNRKDMIDEALLRPGRLEVHMEISLPDEKGRFQILDIHTAKMRTNKVMDEDVDLEELAALTKNFSGAEINGLIKSATSFAFNRHVKVGTMAGISDDVENLRVNRSDFMHALDEVHPAFGVSEEELQAVIQNGIIRYDSTVDELLRSGSLLVEQVRTSKKAPVVNVLLHGPPGSGKTALAAAIAQASQFPFIKLITPDNMVGMGELQKISAITKVFSDSYKSPLSVVVVDNIERLIEWSPMGARYSNAVLQALMVLTNKLPPKDRRLLVIATTSNRPILTDLGFSEFNAVMRVPPITSLPALEYVIQEAELFPGDEDRRDAIRMLKDAGFDKKSRDDPTSRLQIGIKKLLSIIEMSRQEPDGVAERLVTALMELDL